MFKRIPGQERKNGQFVLYSNNNRIYFRCPTSLEEHSGCFYSTYLPYTPEGLTAAKIVLAQLNKDLVLGNFDSSLNRYRPVKLKTEKLETTRCKNIHKITVKEAWSEYIENEKQHLKPTTIKYLEKTIGSYIEIVKNFKLINSKSVLKKIEDCTTVDMTYRVMSRLSQVWLFMCNLTTSIPNPYKEIIAKLKSLNKKGIHYTQAPKIIPSELLQYFIDSLKKDYFAYGNLVEFISLTGCRPSEAIGLTWDKINDNEVLIGQSITRYEGEWVFINSSKNGKIRSFPVYQELKVFLKNLPKRENNYNLVFCGASGVPIDYNNFSRRHWKKYAINYTPYNLRDTFITHQIEKGVPPALVAKWCDNSVAIIEKHYLGNTGNVNPQPY